MQLEENGKKLSMGTAMSYAHRLLKPAIKKTSKSVKEMLWSCKLDQCYK
jgi:hypothetical protein